MKIQDILAKRQEQGSPTNNKRSHVRLSSELSTSIPTIMQKHRDKGESVAYAVTDMYLRDPDHVAGRLAQSNSMKLVKALLVITGEFPNGLLKPSYIDRVGSLAHSDYLKLILQKNLTSSIEASLALAAGANQKYNRTIKCNDGRSRNPVFRFHYHYLRQMAGEHGLTLSAVTIVIHPNLYLEGISKRTIPKLKERLRRALDKALGFDDDYAFVFVPEYAESTALHLHGIMLHSASKTDDIRREFRRVAAEGRTAVSFQSHYTFKRVMSASECIQSQIDGNNARIGDKVPVDEGWADYCGKNLGNELPDSDVCSKIFRLSSRGLPRTALSKYTKASAKVAQICASKIKLELKHVPLHEFVDQLLKEATLHDLYDQLIAS